MYLRYFVLVSMLMLTKTYNRMNIPYKSDRSSFEKYIEKYSKDYKCEESYECGYENFKKNIDYINNHNNNTSNYKLKINEFVDEDVNIIREKLFSYNIKKKDEENKEIFQEYHTEFPKELDYREDNKVTRVKNQGRCGSCWAFSAVGALESKNAIRTGELKEFSEQKLVDCSGSNHGCNGGLMHEAYNDLIWNHSLPLEKDYPYIGYRRYCNVTISSYKGADLLGYNFVLSQSSESLVHALQYNPVCIALAGGPRDFLFYGSGIYDNSTASKINTHAVLLVGYNKTHEIPYWIVKNSWGEKWGEKGYIRVKMEDGDGILGMNQYGLFPY